MVTQKKKTTWKSSQLLFLSVLSKTDLRFEFCVFALRLEACVKNKVGGFEKKKTNACILNLKQLYTIDDLKAWDYARTFFEANIFRCHEPI